MRVSRMSILGALAFGVLLLAPAGAAELVIYRTPAGRVVLSNRPLPSGVELFFRAPDRRAPAQRSEDGSAAGVPASPALAPMPEEQASTPRATPVDPVALALVTRGMAAADVRRTLGAPERVAPLDPAVLMSSDRSSATAGRLERAVWVYPGNTQGGGVLIWFVNGHVERVERVW
jgi:hypothetical protein